jgi:hypothetical protein
MKKCRIPPRAEVDLRASLLRFSSCCVALVHRFFAAALLQFAGLVHILVSVQYED